MGANGIIALEASLKPQNLTSLPNTKNSFGFSPAILAKLDLPESKLATASIDGIGRLWTSYNDLSCKPNEPSSKAGI